MTKQLKLVCVSFDDTVVFPHAIVAVFFSSGEVLNHLRKISENNELFLAAMQKPDAGDEKLLVKQIFQIGTVARVVQFFLLPDGSARILIKGEYRAKIDNIIDEKKKLVSLTSLIVPFSPPDEDIQRYMQLVKDLYTRKQQFQVKVNKDLFDSVVNSKSPEALVCIIAASSSINIKAKQKILLAGSDRVRLDILATALQEEMRYLELHNRIDGKVKERMEKQQKEFYLNEKIKEINRELGNRNDKDNLKEKIARFKQNNPPTDVIAKVENDFTRLQKLHSISPESGVLTNYIELIISLPWNKQEESKFDIAEAAKILDEDHFGLIKAKERILDSLAVVRLTGRIRGAIICLVGPPGTGKTSFGISIARAMGRKFARISLGGLRDEAEIRGHRKTYVGSLPGKIIQALKKCGSNNPLLLLDEIDKISADHRGDPASALLEVLDPEQNSDFVDHFVELPFDLSNVFFITTANSLHNIPYPLLDRMEIIEINGYSEQEKEQIAEKFIIPKILSECGLSSAEIVFQKQTLQDIIIGYTMESGVRTFQRHLAAILRKVAREALKDGYLNPAVKSEDNSCQKEIVGDQTKKTDSTDGTADSEKEKSLACFRKRITPKSVPKYLGKKKIILPNRERPLAVGMANGLAYSEIGGVMLTVEASLSAGSSENLALTGNLGKIMSESAQMAFSYIKSNATKLQLSQKKLTDSQVHLHVPEGATPKDGPSAGVTICLALISALIERNLPSDLAMTGELTLSGRILPIGGLREKSLAANRNRIKKLLLPQDNEKDLEDIPTEIRENFTYTFVSNLSEALTFVFPDFYSFS